MAINTRGAGKMYLDAMLTLWEQRKREQEQQRQYQQQWAMQNMQNQWNAGQDEAQRKFTERQNMLDRNATQTERNRNFNYNQQQDVRQRLDTLGERTTNTVRNMQSMRNEDAMYRQLMQNEGIADPGLRTGQYKDYYTNTTKSKQFGVLHPPEETPSTGSGDAYTLENQIQNEIWRIRSQYNGSNREDIIQRLIGLGDAAQNPYAAYLFSRLKETNPDKFEEMRNYWEQIMASVK